MTASLVTLPPVMTTDGMFAPDVLLTLQPAAALCGCHERTIRRRLRLRAIPGAVRRGVPGAQRWFLPLGGLAADGLIPVEQAAAPGTPPDPGRPGGQGHLQHLAGDTIAVARLSDLSGFLTQISDQPPRITQSPSGLWQLDASDRSANAIAQTGNMDC